MFYRRVMALIESYGWRDPDLAQYAFALVWESLPTWNGEDFEAWCYCICLGAMSDHKLAALVSDCMNLDLNFLKNVQNYFRVKDDRKKIRKSSQKHSEGMYNTGAQRFLPESESLITNRRLPES